MSTKGISFVEYNDDGAIDLMKRNALNSSQNEMSAY